MPRGVSKWHQDSSESNHLDSKHGYRTDEERYPDDPSILAAAKLVAAHEALEERGRGHYNEEHHDESSFALSDDEEDMDRNNESKEHQSATAVNVCRILLLAIIVNASVIGVKLRQRRKNRVPATIFPTAPPTTPSPTTLAPSTLSPTTLLPSLSPTTASPTPKATILVFGVGVAAKGEDDDSVAGFGVTNSAGASGFGVVSSGSDATPPPAPTLGFGGGTT